VLAVISGGEGEDISFSLGNEGGGVGEGRRWHTGTGSVDGGERQCRRDSAMETDTASDLGDVVLGGGGGVAGEEGGGERGALRCKLFWREE
jgi:hypothetical protein